MSHPPKVTVVTPLYNKKATIGRTIHSVLAQTFDDFEFLVVDDGSTDGGADLVEADFHDQRIRIVRQPNAGPAAARNHGARLAKGEFITFLDADDNWRPELLRRAVSALTDHPECGAFTAAFYLEPSGVDRWDSLRPFGFSEGPWRLTPEISSRHLSHCLDAFHPTTAVYRREVFLAHDGFFTEERSTFGEDVFLWIQVLLNHWIYRCATPLAHYHMEDSELGIGGRKGPLPLEPVLTHPGKVRGSSPVELRDTLELWLARYAARAAFMQLDRGDPANAAWLLRTYPLIWRQPIRALKLRLRLLNPGLWNGLREFVKPRQR